MLVALRKWDVATKKERYCASRVMGIGIGARDSGTADKCWNLA